MPEKPISRAEAVKIINVMLNREPSAKIEPSLNVYSDLSEDHWGYADIIEASYTHQYTRNPDGSETWISEER